MTTRLGSIETGRDRRLPLPARVILVRRRFDERLLARLRELLLAESVGPTRVFLQGDGVTLAERGALDSDLAARAQWQICVGSWRRRQPGDPPLPFELSTLGAWLNVVLPNDAPEPDLVSLGRGEGR